MRKLLRYLRIAFSTTCPIACVLLIAFWVRSYKTWDRCYWPGKTLGVQLNSDTGHIVLVADPPTPSSDIVSFFVASLPTDDESETFYKDDVLGFYFKRVQNGFRLDVPFWFLVLLSAVCAALTAAPWIRKLKWRFTLRTLLAITTLVALVLGLIVWFSR